MGRKRQHLKSRRGCHRCKSRKVKCGEERPSCDNCVRRGEACDFESPAPPYPSNDAVRSIRPAQQSALSPAATSTGGQYQDAVTPQTASIPSHLRTRAGPQDLTLLDMELLHHFTTSTSLTLSSDPAVRNYFQIGVPQLGFSHEYVLRCILALAASHFAHFRPESRQYYYAYAREQHTTATSMATPLLSSIPEGSSIAMYFFSILTVFIAFGTLRDEEHHAYEDSVLLPHWLALFRGVRTVLEFNDGAIYKSSISYLFYSSKVNETWQNHQLDGEMLLQFQGYLETCVLVDQDTRQTLLDTFLELRRALYFFYGEERSNEDRIRSLFTWMYRTSGDYHSLLRAGDYKALCILAYFSVLIHRLEHNWWFQGWGINLINRIHAALDEVHRFWITWPIQEIGWVPKRDTTSSKATS